MLTGAMAYPEIRQPERIVILPPPEASRKYLDDQEEVGDIANFLNTVERMSCTTADPSGVTWLELYLLYELGGWNYSRAREGRHCELAEAVINGDPLTILRR